MGPLPLDGIDVNVWYLDDGSTAGCHDAIVAILNTSKRKLRLLVFVLMKARLKRSEMSLLGVSFGSSSAVACSIADKLFFKGRDSATSERPIAVMVGIAMTRINSVGSDQTTYAPIQCFTVIQINSKSKNYNSKCTLSMFRPIGLHQIVYKDSNAGEHRLYTYRKAEDMTRNVMHYQSRRHKNYRGPRMF